MIFVIVGQLEQDVKQVNPGRESDVKVVQLSLALGPDPHQFHGEIHAGPHIPGSDEDIIEADRRFLVVASHDNIDV
ncbi:MAG TPA: hypothetical protein EYQ00_02515 [Dehalococcoidia bacterium]|nr:hypothetical protein [Dehalococcoidia bacterium]